MSNTVQGRVVLLGSQSDDGTIVGVTSGTSQPIDRANLGVVTVFLRSLGVTSGGTILIEEADYGPREVPYSGTWSQIASVSASAFTGGAQQAYHITNCAYGFVRVRISAAITGGGSVFIVLRAQGNG